MRVLRKLWIEFKESIVDGYRSNLNPTMEYEQEQDRKRVIRRSANELWTDDEVMTLFLEYAYKYDVELKLVRTRSMLDAMLENRPAITLQSFWEKRRARLAARRK